MSPDYFYPTFPRFADNFFTGFDVLKSYKAGASAPCYRISHCFYFIAITIDMRKHYLSLILKDFRPIKLIFFVLTSLLLLDELILFLYVKPTLTSISQTNLTPKHFPEILLCPLPSYDQTRLTEVGYEDSYWYSYGIPLNTSFLGWAGDLDQGVENISQSISVIKSNTDCPFIKAWFEEAGKTVKGRKIFELNLFSFPLSGGAKYDSDQGSLPEWEML